MAKLPAKPRPPKLPKPPKPAKQPIAETLGFPIDNLSLDAQQGRTGLLCPFNNRSIKCTKDKLDPPIGTCSIFHGSNKRPTITCPVRFRENWLPVKHAADFFFTPGTSWIDIREVALKTAKGKAAGKIDYVLVSYDQDGKVTNFGSLEIQAVYITGNMRTAYEYYMEDPASRANMDWSGKPKYPRADFLSSSRKRLAPQILFKGGIFHQWKRKQAVALDSTFFATLPDLPEVSREDADIAWLIYDLVLDEATNLRHLTLTRTVYTTFDAALNQITVAEAPPIDTFFEKLQQELNASLVGSTKPRTTSLSDALALEEPPIDPDVV